MNKLKVLAVATIIGTLTLCASLTVPTTHSQVGSLNRQAQAQANSFFSKMSIRCGQYYYYAYREQNTVMYQCKNAPVISVDGKPIPPRRLSEADRLNGVDPLPIAWQGRAVIHLGLCRRQIVGQHGPGATAWEAWVDRNSDAVGLVNAKGHWRFANEPTGQEIYTVKRVLPITCNDVPDSARRTKSAPPSWTGQHRDGGYVLRLPATNDQWFYLGRGPLTLKLPEVYSQIAIDGTNNIRTPNGDAMYLGAQTTDSRALSPRLKLGAVIAKVGSTGEPFSPFESGDPNRGYAIRSDEEIYIAINDSVFSDNRGAHIVVVEGGELNFATGNRLAPPRLLLPEQDAAMDHYPRTTTLTWEKVTGAETYTVEILYQQGYSWYNLSEHYRTRPAARFVPPVQIASNTFTFEWPGLGTNQGRWRVWGIDAQGNEGLKSQWRSFRFTR